MEAVLELWTAKVVGELLPAGRQPTGDVVQVRRPKPSDLQENEDWDTPGEFTEPKPDPTFPDRVMRLLLEYRGERRQTVYCKLEELPLGPA